MPQEKGRAFASFMEKYLEPELGWVLAVQRGIGDRLDFQGPLADGFLVGAKAKGRPRMRADGTMSPDRLSEAVGEAEAAVARLPAGQRERVVPVQIIQRPNYPAARAFAVMECRYFVALVKELRELRAEVEALRPGLAERPVTRIGRAAGAGARRSG